MEIKWNNDVYLSKIAEQIKDAEVVSFDVFDTLLLRTAAGPEDVFDEVGRRLRKSLPYSYDYPPEAFAGMRKEAEARARKAAWEAGQAEEVTIDEIYREFHLDSNYVLCAKECELAVERESVYLNPNVADFMQYCRGLGKKLALVSDSYLSRRQIEELLQEAGFDISMVHAIIVSSDHGVLKYSGKLFRVLLDTFPAFPPDCFLHIGDNRRADIDGALNAGINALYYGAIPYEAFHHISIEQDYLKCDLGEIASLRKLAMSSIPEGYRQDGNRIFFESGCSVFGPVYAFFAEWILEQAKREGINTIIAFMREGELLSGLIKRAAENQKLDMKITPVYISRRTTEIVRIGKVNGNVIDEYVHRSLLKIGELFSIFYLDIERSPFEGIRALTVEQCKAGGHFDELRAFFKSDATIEKINMKVSQQKELLSRYIRSITGESDAITVDVGFRGTMQDCLSRIGANGRGRLLHLMLMGIPYNSRFLIDGTQLRGWLGYGGENMDAIGKIYRRIQLPEAVTNADTGTTIAYREAGGEVAPILEGIRIDEANKRKKSAIWDGVYHFQNYWFMLRSKKGGVLGCILEKKEGFLGILMRLLTMPAYEEALHLGGLSYDESILNSVKSTVCKQNDFTIYEKCENSEDFMDQCEHGVHEEPVYWPEGIVAIREPMYFRKKYLKMLADPFYKRLLPIMQDKRLQNKRIAVYGAGKMGRELVEAAQNAGFAIDCFVDADPRLQDTYIMGVEVLSPEKSVNAVDAYIITPIRFEKEIRERLKALYQDFDNKPYILLYE